MNKKGKKRKVGRNKITNDLKRRYKRKKKKRRKNKISKRKGITSKRKKKLINLTLFNGVVSSIGTM